MDDLFIPLEKDEYDKPYVSFNARTGKCELHGESFPEKTEEFYERLIKWIDRYIKETGGPIEFDFKLTYFNTSSSKRILQLMMKLRDYKRQGGKVTSRWSYHPEDVDLEEDIEDLKVISRLDLQMVPDEKMQYRGLDPDKRDG